MCTSLDMLRFLSLFWQLLFQLLPTLTGASLCNSCSINMLKFRSTMNFSNGMICCIYKGWRFVINSLSMIGRSVSFNNAGNLCPLSCYVVSGPSFSSCLSSSRSLSMIGRSMSVPLNMKSRMVNFGVASIFFGLK